MSDHDSNSVSNGPASSAELKTSSKGGRRKDGKPFKEDNLRADGSYKVGRGRTPQATRFAKEDGRKRGRRPKGTSNFETIFNIEAGRVVEVAIDGKKVKLPAIQTATLTAFYKANKQQHLPAIALVMEHARRFLEKGERKPVISQETDAEIIAEWLADLTGSGPGTITDDFDLAGEEPSDDARTD